MARLLVNALIVLLMLIIFSFLGAIVFPGLPNTGSSVDTYAHNFFLLVIPVLLVAVIGHFLGRGIRGIKNPFESLGLAYLGAFLVGGILALLSLLNFGYSARINFSWLGGTWYDPWLTIFLIGAPLMLAFLA